MRRWYRLLFVVGALWAGGQARAQQVLDRTVGELGSAIRNILDLRPSDTTDWRIGLGPYVNPTFEGSRHYQVNPAPLISVRYRDVLKVDNNNVDFTAFDQVVDLGEDAGSGKLDFGPVINLDFGRSEHDDPALRGMGGVAFSFEMGAYASFTTPDYTVDAEMSQDVADGHHGAVLDLHGGATLYRGPKLVVSADTTVSWASANYMKAFFGINPTKSALSGLPVFHAGSSFKSASMSVLSNYDLSRHWSLASSIGYKRLVAAAARSPLVEQRGSPNQLSGSAFAVYIF